MLTNRIRIAAVFCCLFTAAFTGAAHAQMGMMGHTPAMGGIFNPEVGLGANYDMTTSKGEKMTMSFAIVGTDTINGKSGYWTEVGMSGGKIPGTMYIKSLSVVDGNQMMTQRMIMTMNGTAYQMPDQMVQMNSHASQTNITTDGQNLGTESITVPAGTFAADHYRSKDGSDIWVAKDAGPWGMVKMQSKEGTTMVLTKVYHDAKDQITGTPQPFNPMAMAQAQQSH
jgi:hypothetical protein